MTNAIKTEYESLPETISIPRKYVNRRAEVIILVEDEAAPAARELKEFYGVLPDFPDRGDQDVFEVRDEL